MKKIRIPSAIPFLLHIYILFLIGIVPAFAEGEGGGGGLDKVNSFLEKILTVLHGISITIVTIAIIWSGYKFLFKNADIRACATILGGGLLIGGATEIAGYLLGA
jgi:type IV secretory pathway VirB2 component (pilin)